MHDNFLRISKIFLLLLGCSLVISSILIVFAMWFKASESEKRHLTEMQTQEKSLSLFDIENQLVSDFLEQPLKKQQAQLETVFNAREQIVNARLGWNKEKYIQCIKVEINQVAPMLFTVADVAEKCLYQKNSP